MVVILPQTVLKNCFCAGVFSICKSCQIGVAQRICLEEQLLEDIHLSIFRLRREFSASNSDLCLYNCSLYRYFYKTVRNCRFTESDCSLASQKLLCDFILVVRCLLGYLVNFLRSHHSIRKDFVVALKNHCCLRT